ncbi:hypothetical protein [Actinomadura sp. WMMA1423]|uniref:hypothetical protein n=1 Tax=Actinomadura sp. WMMA1423 TaxID=2591108 RepID=UPI00197A7D33|nr:hypothetical protein [Actinomadura sp. WMMA1423]
MQVWILARGEDSEGEQVLGVYASRDAARADFEREALVVDRAFTIDRAFNTEDGSVYIHGGCDWVTLTPWTVQGAPVPGPAAPALSAQQPQALA